MKLLKLTLHNFMGIRDFVFEPNGADATVSGENGLGKSTIFSAETWLLTQKDCLGKIDTDFEIKTKDENEEVIHFLEHSVEGVYLLESGKTITFYRCYKEEWTRAPGAASESMTGHTTVFKVDGHNKPKGEYNKDIDAIIPRDKIRELKDPMWMPSLAYGWQNLRNRLFTLIGNVTDADVIAANENLFELTELMGDSDLTKFRKSLDDRKKETNKELAEIPVRIRTIDDGMIGTIEAVNEIELTADRELLSGLQTEKATLNVGGAVGEKTLELRKIEAEILEIETKIKREQNAGRSELDGKISNKATELSAAQSAVRAKEFSISEAETIVKGIEPKLVAKRAEFEAEAAKEFTYSGKDVCPACNQPLPASEVEAATNKAREEFNLKQSKELERIQAEGVAMAERKEKMEQGVIKAQGELEPLVAKVATIEGELAELKAGQSAPKEIVWLEIPEWKSAWDRKDVALKEISELNSGSTAALESIVGKINAVQTRISDAESRKGKLEHRATETTRKNTLAEKQKTLAKDYEELERQWNLTELLTRAKSALISEQVNSKFEFVKFKLFDVQTNGQIAECCIATGVNGVEYHSLNHGQKIRIGMDIIRTFQKAEKLHPVCFVDFAESIDKSKVVPMDCQVIQLRRADISELTVEYAS